MGNLPFHGAWEDSRMTHFCRRLLRGAIRVFKDKSEYFATYHERAKYSAMVHTWADVNENNVAIVMQGPVWTPDDFTLETLRLYQKIFPACRLIVSTWEDTPPRELEQLRSTGVELVLCAKPEDPGHSNINMQIISASRGMQRARELGAEWILKTRSDQRLYNPNVLSFLIATARTFPVAGASSQQFRIIGIGQGSLKYVPYHVTDQTLFGHADDMLDYWSTPLRPMSSYDAGDKTLAELFPSLSIKELLDGVSAETYVCSEYLKRLGRPIDWTIEDSWNAYRDHFCFVDYSATDFFWVKGQDYTLGEYMYRYDAISNRKEMNFSEWMLLYSGQVSTEIARQYQPCLEQTYNSAIARQPPD